MSDKPGESPEIRLAKLEAILATAVNAIVTIDAAGIIESVNPSATALFGYTPGEMIGNNVRMLMPEPYAREHDGYIDAFNRTGARKIIGIGREVAGRRRDGSTFPIHLAVSVFEADGRRHFAGIITDLSEQKRVEEELRSSRERLQATLDVAEIGLWQWDPQSATTIEIEPAYGRLMRLPEGQRTLGTPEFLERVLPEDRAGVAAAIEQARLGRPFSAEYRCRLGDGSVRWLLDKGDYFTHSADGRKLMRGATIDVTARKTAEAALKESERRLVTAQKLEAIGQLAGGIAHDFNNLLTVITGNQELLEMRLSGERELLLLKRAQEAAAMGARLTSRLLTFARRRQLEPQLIALNDRMIGMVELLRRSIGEQVMLTTSLASDLWTVEADPSEVENAVLNLAINARDAMPRGGTLVIETANCRLDGDEMKELAAGDFVRISVSDTGTGMTPEVLARAFEPFFTTKEPGRGTGLGLPTIYGFAKLSGGTVTIYSEVGKGTTVNIYLPRAGEPGAARDAPGGGPLLSSRGEKVLLVEDSPEVRAVTRERLEQLGYRVVEAPDGHAAIKALEESGRTFDLVFSDVVMPGGLTGFDVAKWVASHAPSVRVLLTSGYPDQVAFTDAPDVPKAKLLRKPYNRSELARAIRDALT
jgi:PAS domain S-box-containing protein